MWFMNSIISWLKSIEDYFYDAFLEVYGWMDPLWLLAYPLLYISRGFGWLAYYFGEFNTWLYWANTEIGKILSYANIYSYFADYFDAAINAWGWVLNYWDNVLGVVRGWWDGISLYVQGWIDIATEGLDELKVAWDTFWTVTFPEWTGKLDTLKAAWDNFWTVTLPTLVSFSGLASWWAERLKDIEKLLNDTLKIWFPFYDSLSQLWGSVAEFITDPLGWLEAKFTDWFLGAE